MSTTITQMNKRTNQFKKAHYWVTRDKSQMQPLKVLLRSNGDIDDLCEYLRKTRLFGEATDIGKRSYSVVDYNGLCFQRNVRLNDIINRGTYECPFIITF
jgi:hypothetical protein